jgi:hypothetical protein
MSLHINSFVRRQTESSSLSHWTLSDKKLMARIAINFDKQKPGYCAGVILVPIEGDGFFSPVVTLQSGDKLMGEYVPRREGEDPRKHIHAVGCKVPAEMAWVVLYSHDVLVEGGENETDDDWEVICINASPTLDDEPAPMPPETLIANHFGLSGGTSTRMNDSEFVAALKTSVLYWKDKAMVCG